MPKRKPKTPPRSSNPRVQLYRDRADREVERKRKYREKLRREALAEQRAEQEQQEAARLAERAGWSLLKEEVWRVAGEEAEAERKAAAELERQRQMYDAEVAYNKQRQQAAEDAIMAAMNRRWGRAGPIGYDEMPEKADSRYDPRRW